MWIKKWTWSAELIVSLHKFFFIFNCSCWIKLVNKSCCFPLFLALICRFYAINIFQNDLIVKMISYSQSHIVYKAGITTHNCPCIYRKKESFFLFFLCLNSQSCLAEVTQIAELLRSWKFRIFKEVNSMFTDIFNVLCKITTSIHYSRYSIWPFLYFSTHSTLNT